MDFLGAHNLFEFFHFRLKIEMEKPKGRNGFFFTGTYNGFMIS